MVAKRKKHNGTVAVRRVIPELHLHLLPTLSILVL